MTIIVTLMPAAPGEESLEMTLEGVDTGTISQATAGWLTFTGITTRKPVASFPPGAVRFWKVVEDAGIVAAPAEVVEGRGLRLVTP